MKNVKDVLNKHKNTKEIFLKFAHNNKYIQGTKFLLFNVINVENFILKMNKDLNVQIVKIVILDKKRIIFLLKKLTAVFLVMKIIFLNAFNVMIGMQE